MTRVFGLIGMALFFAFAAHRMEAQGSTISDKFEDATLSPSWVVYQQILARLACLRIRITPPEESIPRVGFDGWRGPFSCSPPQSRHADKGNGKHLVL